MESSIDKYLKNIYYDPASPGSFSGLNKLWVYIRSRSDKPKALTRAKIKNWLSYQDTHSVHHSSRNKFPRERIIVSSLDMQWDADLADMSGLKEYNDGVTFLLVAIDLLSRYCWLRPLKSKNGQQVKAAFADIFRADNRHPSRLRTDRGKEFYNKNVRDLLAETDVHHFSTSSVVKAGYSERLISTLKRRIYRYLYAHQTFRYIDDLQHIASSYNHTVHGTTKVTPASVTKDNDLELYMRLYMPYVNKIARQTPKFSFSVGDLVRKAYKKGPFSRSYHENFSEQLYKITFCIASTPPRYQLVDGLGNSEKGSFYAHQLVKVPKDDQREFKIEEVIKYRKSGKKKEALVKWYGHDHRHSSWIPEREVKKYQPGGSVKKAQRKKKPKTR